MCALSCASMYKFPVPLALVLRDRPDLLQDLLAACNGAREAVPFVQAVVPGRRSLPARRVCRSPNQAAASEVYPRSLLVAWIAGRTGEFRCLTSDRCIVTFCAPGPSNTNACMAAGTSLSSVFSRASRLPACRSGLRRACCARRGSCGV